MSMDNLEKEQCIATRAKDAEFINAVYEIVPQKYITDGIEDKAVALHQAETTDFYLYIDAFGFLTWGVDMDVIAKKGEPYVNAQIIDNASFIFLLRLVYGNIVER